MWDEKETFMETSLKAIASERQHEHMRAYSVAGSMRQKGAPDGRYARGN